MNIQSERLENHTMRFTVEVESEKLEAAKREASRKISKQVSIPGFRKGKAPYNVLVRYLGEAPIMEEAIETLGQSVYRDTLDASTIEPYGPGQLEDIKYEPTLTFVYTVPLVPTVELNAYRDVRVAYEEPTINDEDVDRAIKALQEQAALVEDSQNPAEMGNRVTIDIHSQFVESKDESDDTADETTEEGDEHAHNQGEGYIHEHDLAIILSEGDDEPVLPGFSAALVGVNAGETREFDLTVPDDADEYGEEAAGRAVHFEVIVKSVSVVTLPPINDEFAARFTNDFPPEDGETLELTEDGEEVEREPLTLLELRMKVRKSLEEEATRRAKDEYADNVLAEIVEGATINYPEMMVEDQIDSLIENLEQRLRQQGLSVDMYLRITGRTKDEIRTDYRDPAITTLKRSLVLTEVVVQEQIRVTDDEYEAHMDKLVSQFGDQAEQIRKTFESSAFRNNIVNQMLQEKVFERLVALGKGEAPELSDAPEANTEETEASTDTETSSDTE